MNNRERSSLPHFFIQQRAEARQQAAERSYQDFISTGRAKLTAPPVISRSSTLPRSPIPPQPITLDNPFPLSRLIHEPIYSPPREFLTMPAQSLISKTWDFSKEIGEDIALNLAKDKIIHGAEHLVEGSGRYLASKIAFFSTTADFIQRTNSAVAEGVPSNIASQCALVGAASKTIGAGIGNMGVDAVASLTVTPVGAAAISIVASPVIDIAADKASRNIEQACHRVKGFSKF